MSVTNEYRDRAKRLLVLGAGPSQLGLLETARKRGLFVIAADRNSAAVGFPLADRRALISAEDEPALERLATAEDIDGVIAPGIDWSVALAARISAKLGLPHPLSVESAQLAVAKLRQRELFVQAGLPHTRYSVATRGEEAETAARELGFPLVVKAPDRQGQRGMALARRHEELAPAVEMALAESRSGLCLIEKLEPGVEVTVIGFSLDAHFHTIAVTERKRDEREAFGVTLEHRLPSSLNQAEVEQAASVAEQAAALLGIEQGPTYTQLIVGRQGARLGERAARLGGGHDAELCAAALGIDLNELALDAALGEPIDPRRLEPRARVSAACTRFLVSPPGRLIAVHGAANAAAAPGVQFVRIFREPGHEIRPLRSRSDRAGAVLALAPTREQAVSRAELAADLVRFEVAGSVSPS